MNDHSLLKPGELQLILRNHPNKIPIYVTKSTYADKDLPDISKHKFLIPNNYLMGEFIYSIRRWIKIRPEQAIFVFIGNNVPSSTLTMDEVYNKYKSHDGMLRITYTSENTFG
jgi:GABA(A) receptor-associated protein